MRMSRRVIAVLGCLMLGCVAVGCSQQPRFREVLTPDSIPGWEIKKGSDVWTVQDGVLHCGSGGKTWGGGIGTVAEYINFVLDFEFKLSPGGNSGVYVRTPPVGHPSTVALEIQLLDDEAPQYKALEDSQYCGSVYKIVAPRKRVSRPAGEWNHMRITALDDHITIDLNDERIVDADARAYPELLKRCPRGFIGFQDHHTECWFRNIRLADLGGTVKTAWLPPPSTPATQADH